MVTENDPLAEADEPCTRCDQGMVQVRPAYAEHLYPDPTAEQVAGLTAEQLAGVWARIEERRAAARWSFYPCRTCRPTQFYRWVGGHMDSGHNPTTCAECVELMGGARAAARAARAYADLTPRKDLDD